MGSQGQPREGILSTTTFPGLIYSIFRLRETGVLTFTGETSEKSIYIKGGRPIFATSGDRDDRLGNIFFKAGLVTLDTLLTGVDDSIRLKKRLGTILVEAGSIQPHDLVEAVLTQSKSIICSLFLWTRGRYRYAPGPLPSEEVITLKLSASEIVLEGVKRIESWERIWEAVGDLDACYRTCDGIEQQVRDLKLALPEWTLLSHFDRSITVRDLCGSSEMKDFEICRLLWALVTLGIVQRTSASR
jgi:hypothetical protein